MKLAQPHPTANRLAILPGGSVVTREAAAQMGFTVASLPASQPEGSNWKEAILALPEAQGRAKAAARITELHSERTLSTHQAAALLRSLPIEQQDAPEVSHSAEVDRLITRALELRQLALSTKRTPEARDEHKRVTCALSLIRNGMEAGPAVGQAGVDGEPLQAILKRAKPNA